MILTTLCYLERDGEYLMLHRVSKKNDLNKDKWIGVGGKFEPGEAPEECLVREVREETGLILHSYRFRGVLTFCSDLSEPEYIFLYTSDDFSGSIKACDEGELVWVAKGELETLNLWEGDKVMFRLLEERNQPFSLKLCYQGDSLVDVKEC